jgi:hypothetical protein
VHSEGSSDRDAGSLAFDPSMLKQFRALVNSRSGFADNCTAGAVQAAVFNSIGIWTQKIKRDVPVLALRQTLPPPEPRHPPLLAPIDGLVLPSLYRV